MEAGEDVGAASSLARQYRAFRESAIELVPLEHEDELRALAPEIDDEKTRLELSPNPQSMFRAKELHGEVLVLLGGGLSNLAAFVGTNTVREPLHLFDVPATVHRHEDDLNLAHSDAATLDVD